MKQCLKADYLLHGVEKIMVVPRLAALALKSRVYLYAASPLYNGNTEMYADFRSPLDGRQLIAQEKSQAKWEISATQTKYAIDEVEKS